MRQRSRTRDLRAISSRPCQAHTRRRSQPEPAGWLKDKSNVSGDRLRWLTYSFCENDMKAISASIVILAAAVLLLGGSHIQHSDTKLFVQTIGCGVAVGIWCAFYVEYHIGSRYRIGSFPIPVVFFHLEHGDWEDFPVPELQAWAAMFANVITITALATLPLWLVSWRQHKNESTHNAA